MLSHKEASRIYDRIGSIQNLQAFYEDRATDLLLAQGDFDSAKSVFEFGCGTGRFAAGLLSGVLPPDSRYRGVDVSPKMVRLARERLAPYSDRAEVSLTGGAPPAEEPSDSCDRFVSNYVFDLLSTEDMLSVLGEARRMLRPTGLLCLVGLSTGVGPLSRAVATGWGWVHGKTPWVLGGCRPIDLSPLVTEAGWHVRFHAEIVAFGIPSGILIAHSPGAARQK